MASSPHPSYIKAGRIASRVLNEVRSEIKTSAKLIKICTKVEKKILEYGGQPAFPCNICVNHIAAHRTSPIGDQTEVPEWGLVKIDIGVHIDGHIADTACTVDVDGTLEGFVAATDDALKEAIGIIEPGVSLGDVGKEIEKVIKAYGLRPIKNLSGHNIERYRLHGGKGVPNVKRRGTEKVEVGEYYAIEPYATSGAGMVTDSEFVYIFKNEQKDTELEGVTEKLRKHLKDRYGPFPFTMRWVGTTSEKIDLELEFRKLLKAKAIRGYPMLIEKKRRPVSQSEHTVFISEEGPIILTQGD